METQRHTHTLVLPNRTVVVTLTEYSDRVEFGMRCNRYGALGDEMELARWLAGLLAPYEADPRPTLMTNEHTGERLAVFGDSTQAVAVINPSEP